MRISRAKRLLKDSAARIDRSPALCDRSKGWQRGAGKCVRVKAAQKSLSNAGKTIASNTQGLGAVRKTIGKKEARNVAIGAGIIAFLGATGGAASYLENKYDISGKALELAYKGLNSDQASHFIQEMDNRHIPKNIVGAFKKASGAAKVFIAETVLKRTDGEMLSFDKKNNFSTWKVDDSDGEEEGDAFVSVGSIKDNVVVFDTYHNDDFAEWIEDPVYEMTFKVNDSFDRKISMDTSEAVSMLRMTTAIFNEHLKQLPDNTIVTASAWDKDGAGKKRKNIYERMGFVPQEDGRLWGVVKGGKVHPPDSYIQNDSILKGYPNRSQKVFINKKTA